MRLCMRPYTLPVRTCAYTHTYMFIRTHRYVYTIMYINIKMDMYTRMPASVFVYVGFSVRAAVDV